LAFVHRGISNYGSENGPANTRVRLAYAHARPDALLRGTVTPARLSGLSPYVEFVPKSGCWQAALRWLGSRWNEDCSAVAVFIQYPDHPDHAQRSRWQCRLAPVQHDGIFLFNLRGPGDFLFGNPHHALWGPGSWGDYHQWPQDGSLRSPDAAPGVVLMDLQNVPLEAAYAFLALTGETGLSPPCAIRSIGTDPLFAPAVIKRLTPTPPGVYGMRLYLRRARTRQWHLQPWHYGRSLWPTWQSELHLHRFKETGIGPGGSGDQWSAHNEITERLGFTDESDCTTDQKDMPLYCPIVSPHRQHRAFGGRWGKVKFFIPDSVTDANGVEWPIPREWDCVMQEEGKDIEWRHSEMQGQFYGLDAFCGWASHSYSADNCFSPRLRGLYINPNGKDFSVGVCVSRYSNGSLGNGHTCSEYEEEDCFFGAHVSRHIAGGQSVNFRMKNPGVFHGQALPTPDAFAFHFAVKGGQFEILGQRCDPSVKAGVFAIDETATVFVSGLFMDGAGGLPAKALVTLGNEAGGAVVFTGPNKLNNNMASPFRSHMVEALGRQPFELDLGRCFGQDNGNVQYACIVYDPALVDVHAAKGSFFYGKVMAVAPL